VEHGRYYATGFVGFGVWFMALFRKRKVVLSMSAKVYQLRPLEKNDEDTHALGRLISVVRHWGLARTLKELCDTYPAAYEALVDQANQIATAKYGYERPGQREI